jgi:chorismate synthase
MDAHSIRPFATLKEYQGCTTLQEEVWGEGFSERVSAAILMIANRLGGLAAGAYRQDGTLDAFVFGLTGWVDGAPVHWSDMLAVRPGIRDRGLGSRLKRYQREVLLRRGIRKMHWTFDPLQGRNAHINFHKLGIVSRDYVVDMYGETDSPLHRGIGTDRLLATWEMDSARVVQRLADQGLPPQPTALVDLTSVLSVEIVEGSPVPGEAVVGLDRPALLLPVPGSIEGLMERDLSLAARWRKATRKVLTHYLSRGFQVEEFFRGSEVSHYLLVRSSP